MSHITPFYEIAHPSRSQKIDGVYNHTHEITNVYVRLKFKTLQKHISLLHFFRRGSFVIIDENINKL